MEARMAVKAKEAQVFEEAMKVERTVEAKAEEAWKAARLTEKTPL